MADSTIDSELIFLINPWPASRVRTEPADSLTLASSYTHNVSAQTEYRVGDVIQVYNTGNSAGKPGWAEFIYLQVGTQNADNVLAAKQVVVPDSATVWYQVTNDPDSCIKSTGSCLFAVAISAMTNAYFGWFWCGGVCPEEFVSDLGGNYATEGNVAAGSITVHDLAADALGFGPMATTEAHAGFALAADA